MIIKKALHQENMVQLFLKLELANSQEKEIILAEIERRNLSEKEMNRAEKEYKSFKKYLEEEASKPLPWYWKVSCILVPFSACESYGNNKLNERDSVMINSTHNTLQRKEIYKYSKIGLIIYGLIFIPLIIARMVTQIFFR
nr:hypothetical protein [uncultured Carboxylicivirga sp.]